MVRQSAEVLINGGSASPGPPLGPALGPMGVNINDVVAQINEKTRGMEGMKVPVKIVVDPKTKEFEIEIGLPPTSALIKKEAGIEKGSQDGTPVGNLEFEQVMKIANLKKESLLSYIIKGAIKEILGVCQSVGVTVDGRSPREISTAVDKGEFDSKLR